MGSCHIFGLCVLGTLGINGHKSWVSQSHSFGTDSVVFSKVKPIVLVFLKALLLSNVSKLPQSSKASKYHVAGNF